MGGCYTPDTPPPGRATTVDTILKGCSFSTWQLFTGKLILISKNSSFSFKNLYLIINEWAQRESAVLQKLTANNTTINNNDLTIIDKVQQDPYVRQLIDPIERELSQKWKINLKLITIRDIG